MPVIAGILATMPAAGFSPGVGHVTGLLFGPVCGFLSGMLFRALVPGR